MSTRLPPHLLLVTGPAAAGKTSAADAWAQRQEAPAARISIDDIRDQLKSGYANPEDGWNSATEEQYHLARRQAAAMARTYLDAGYGCVIDDAIFPSWPAVSHRGWKDELRLPHDLVVLLPSFDAVVARNAKRSGHRRLRRETLRIIYHAMQGWRNFAVPIIDNTSLTPEETARAIEESLASQPGAPRAASRE